MKDLKKNLEQTCIEFEKFVTAKEDWTASTEYMTELWKQFQEQQAKEVMDILDACDNPQEPNDKLKDAAFQAYLIENNLELQDAYVEYSNHPFGDLVGFSEWVAHKYHKDTIKQRLEEGEEEGFDDDLMDKDCKGFDRLKESVKEIEPYSEERFGKHFGSTQDRINHEILHLIADNNALQEERWKKNEDVLINIAEICKSLSGQIDNVHSLIKLTNNIASANEIALNHLEDNKLNK